MDKETVVIYLSNLHTEEYYSAIERKSYYFGNMLNEMSLIKRQILHNSTYMKYSE